VTQSVTPFKELRRRTDALLASLQALGADLLAELAQERQHLAELARTEQELARLEQQFAALRQLAVRQAQPRIDSDAPADGANVAGAAQSQRDLEELRQQQAALRLAQDQWQTERGRLLGELRRQEQQTQAKESVFSAERASLDAELETLRYQLAQLSSQSGETEGLRRELAELHALEQQWEGERQSMLDQQAGMGAAQAEAEHARQQLQAEVARLQSELGDRTAAFDAQTAPLASDLETARQELDQLPALREELRRLNDERANLLQHIGLLEQHWYQREATFTIERAGWRRELDNAQLANQEAEAELGRAKRRSRGNFVALIAAGLLALLLGFSLSLAPLHSSLPVEPAGGVIGILVAAAFFTYAFRTGFMSGRAPTVQESPRGEAAAVLTGPMAPAPPAQPVGRVAQAPAPAARSAKRRWRRPVLTVLLVVGVIVLLLPIIAILRGAAALLNGSPAYVGANWIGLLLAFVALSMGTIFFAYSIKYYLATAVVLLGLGGGLNDNAASRLERIQQPGPEGNGSGGATTTGWLPAGAEPFVSVHIATYNEKRVIERLLEACTQFEYPNYEVIVVDDSTDESTQILERWKGFPRLKLIHRPSRDGFKGGALKEALAATDPRAQYVVVFDADSIPFPDSIQRLLYHFYQQPGPVPVT
jgi:hypothetical protein